MPKIFLSVCLVSMWSPKEGKGNCVDGDIFFSGFMLVSKKKKGLSSEFCKFSMRCEQTFKSQAPWITAVYGFWQETKTPVMREKKHQNSQNFSLKMSEKISHFLHFFALIGNTAYALYVGLKLNKLQRSSRHVVYPSSTEI